MTQDIWKLANLETHIQQLLESVGLHSHGLVTLKKIKGLQSPHTIDITLTVSCARNSAMEVTMQGNQKPSQPKPDSPKQSSETSSPSIFVHFPRTSGGTAGLILNLEQLETLQRSVEENGGSLDAETIQLPSGKLLHMTLKEV